MRKTLLLCLCALTSTVYGQWLKPVSCPIKGELTGLNSPEAILIPYNKDLRFEGIKLPVRNNKFKYTLRTDTIQAYELMVPHEAGFYYAAFFPETEGVRISYDAQQDRIVAHATGANNLDLESYEKTLIELFQPRMDSIDARKERLIRQGRLYTKEMTILKEQWDNTDNRSILDSLSKLIGELNRTGRYFTKEGDDLEAENDRIFQEREQWTHEYIAQNPNLANFYRLLTNTRISVQRKKEVAFWIEIYDRHYADLFARHPFHATMEGYRLYHNHRAGVGLKYIDATLPDTEGRATKISEVIGGKVARIDLWASWCGSYRRHSISVIPVYEKHKDRGFTVIGITREYKNGQAWRAALEHDGYPWRNLIELDDQQLLWAQYGLGSGGGGSFLIDRNGVILAVNPSPSRSRRS